MSCRRILIGSLVVIASLACSAAWSEEATPKPPRPDKAKQATALQEINTVLADDYAKVSKVELARKRSGDSMTILLMLDDQTYYYFQYTRNYLYAYSSDQQFNTMLSELKDDKRVLEAKKDDAPYQFILTNKKKVDDFKNRYGL